MKKISLLITIMVILFAQTGCKRGGTSGIKTENFSTGKAGELLIVMDKELFGDTVVSHINKTFTQPQPSINQTEPMFDLLKLKNADFNSYFQKHRNIVHFDINASYGVNKMDIERNVWSSPQVYVHFKCNNVDSCIQLFFQHQSEIIDILYENDLARLQSFYLKDHNAGIEKKIKEKFGYTISVPQNYSIAREEADFIWLLFRTTKNDRCIMIYKTTPTQLTQTNLIQLRDQITKKYIPGAVTGAYPIIDQNPKHLKFKELNIGSKAGAELRGLWISVNDIMGGPFCTYVFNEPTGKNCIVVDGFVHAPHENKRDYIHEVEAIIKTIR